MNVNVQLIGAVEVQSTLDRTSAVMANIGARQAVIGTSLYYAPFVHNGTGVFAGHSAWDVVGLQVFQAGGQTVFTRHTHHEGQAPQPFLTDALAAQVPAITQNIGAAADAIVAGAAEGTLTDALYQSGLGVRDAAIANIHSQTGDLAQSITVDVL